VTLSHSWPGGSPALLVTRTKSHDGNDTIIGFARGARPKRFVCYEPKQWVFQRSFVAGLEQRPDVGVVSPENTS
jgi:hypothetical protein